MPNCCGTCKSEDCEIYTVDAKVEEEIRHAEASLQGLVAKRLLLRSEHNYRHDPILRLPLELSTHIFELCLPMRDKWGRISSVKKYYSLPSHFASVSRGWRDIAWSIPRLWTTIQFSLGFRNANVARFASDWIHRSRTLPLVFYIKYRNPNNLDTLTKELSLLDRLAPVFEVVNQCSDRWETLNLELPGGILSGFRGKDECVLERLRIRVLDNCQLPTFDLPTDAQWGPKRLNIDRLSFTSIDVSWRNLTSATVHQFRMEDLVNLFQNARRMTFCQIRYPLWMQDTPSTLAHVKLETLELQLSTTLRDDAAYTLGAFTLPNLKAFKCNLLDILHREHLPDLVRRSSCRLNKLTIGETFIDSKHNWRDPERLERFVPFPGVTRLGLGVVTPRWKAIQDAITRILSLDDSHAQNYFPDLRFLTLRMTPTSFMWKLVPKILDREFLTLYVKYEDQAEDQAEDLTAILNSKFEASQIEKWDVVIKKDGFELSARSRQ